MGDEAPQRWTITARNLAEHANNPIHTDEGAKAQGFPAALVAGVTTYAYLTHPVAAAWGVDWLARGGGEVRFRMPVFAGRPIECVPTPGDDGSVTIDAVDAGEDRNPRAVFTARRAGGPVPAARPGDDLDPMTFVLDESFGPDYGSRAGDDLDIYQREGIIHPAVWPAIANRLVHTQLAKGSWIHTRSITRHHALVHRGDAVTARAVVVDRFVRHGERAVVDVVIERDGTPIATLEHEAIVDLAVV